MKNDGAAFDMPEKASTDAGPLARSFDQSGKIRQDKFVVVPPNDAELGLQRRERVVGDFRPGLGDRGEESRFAGVWQANETGIGDKLQAQPNPSLAPRPTGIGSARRAIGRA